MDFLDPRKNFKKLPQEDLSGVAIGLTMVVGVCFFTYIGYKIDQKIGRGQTWTLVGIFVGLFYCGYEIWKLVRNDQKKDKQKAGDK